MNKMYVEECGYYDGGRLLTWLPYKLNQDSSALVHDISQEKLLGDQVDKYYAKWYRGTQVYPYPPIYIFIMLFIMFILMVYIYGDQNEKTNQCAYGYFGLVEKQYSPFILEVIRSISNEFVPRWNEFVPGWNEFVPGFSGI